MNNQYISYDYKELNIHNDLDLRYLDALECFGWEIDENKSITQKKYILKRMRHIVNKTELIRLERHLDSCFHEIVELQKSIHSHAIAVVLTIAMIGTVFMTLSTFAIVHEPPLVLPCILLAIPGFAGWILPVFLNKKLMAKQRQKVRPFIEKKYDEIDQICHRAIQLKDL